MNTGTETYVIKDEALLKEIIRRLDSYKARLENDIHSLSYIQKQINENWESDGRDIESINAGLTSCLNRLDKNFVPTLEQFIKTVSELSTQTDEIKSETVESSNTGNTGNTNPYGYY